MTEIIHLDTAGELKSASKYSDLNQVGELNDTVNNDITESFEYARYWHGYLIILRPLLMFFNVSQIRNICTTILTILSIILLYKIYKEFDLGTSIIFFFGLIVCDYFYMGISIQGVFVFLIATISSIILLKRDILNKPLFFMIIGGLACFFDLLTVPVITLGIPLLINCLINNKNQYSMKESIIEIIKCCILWAIGFFGIWFMKWALVDIIYKRQLIHTAIEQFLYRTKSTEDAKLIFSDVLYWNIICMWKPFVIANLIVIIITIIKIAKQKNLEVLHINIKEIVIYLIVGCIPIAWYFVFKQHSWQHYFFTYRNLWLVSTSIYLIIYNVIKIDKEEQKKLEQGKEK